MDSPTVISHYDSINPLYINSLFTQSSNTTATFRFRHTQKKVIIPVSSGIYEALFYRVDYNQIFHQTKQSQVHLSVLISYFKVMSWYSYFPLRKLTACICPVLLYITGFCSSMNFKKENFSSSFLMLTEGKNSTSSNVTNY